MTGKIVLIIEKFQQSEVLGKRLGLFQIQQGVWEEVQLQENLVIFFFIQTDTKLLFRYEYFFSLKADNVIINCVPISFTNILCLKDSPHNGT